MEKFRIKGWLPDGSCSCSHGDALYGTCKINLFSLFLPRIIPKKYGSMNKVFRKDSFFIKNGLTGCKKRCTFNVSSYNY